MLENHNYRGDESGKVYNHWTVVSRDGKDTAGRWKWLCRCRCGTERSLPGHYLRQGKSKHCGCIPRKSPRKLTPDQIHDRLTLPRECSKCHRVLPPEQFGMVATRHWCNECKSSYTSTHNKAHGRRHWLLDKYGITQDEFEHIFQEQDGKCAICQRVPSGNNLANVDHDHSLSKADAGFIRGILCMQCNIGIGKFSDNPDIVMAAHNYLKKSLDKRPML